MVVCVVMAVLALRYFVVAWSIVITSCEKCDRLSCVAVQEVGTGMMRMYWRASHSTHLCICVCKKDSDRWKNECRMIVGSWWRRECDSVGKTGRMTGDVWELCGIKVVVAGRSVY